GRDYGRKFLAVFREISERYDAALVPFMLDGFAADHELFQDDGIHPTREAQPLILNNVYRQLAPLL
ncbi:MAG: arylesterase, partial [Burkholderiales bacterium]|nr:arylesterase [Burkholderiales bacterium]